MSEPLSFSVVAADVPAAGRHFRIEADAEQRAALAAALGIVGIAALTAELDLRPAAGGALAVRGTLSATVTQTDVVTLEPVEQQVSEALDVTLLPAEVPGAGRSRHAFADAEDPEGRDRYRDGRIDLGVIVAEHLALGLDPYPRAPGSAFAGYGEDGTEPEASPFAALAKLKRDDT